LSDDTASMNGPLTRGVNHLRFRTMAVAPSAPAILYAANSIKELLSTSNVYSELYQSSNSGFSCGQFITRTWVSSIAFSFIPVIRMLSILRPQPGSGSKLNDRHVDAAAKR
jgi:hypothetical protein